MAGRPPNQAYPGYYQNASSPPYPQNPQNAPHQPYRPQAQNQYPNQQTQYGQQPGYGQAGYHSPAPPNAPYPQQQYPQQQMPYGSQYSSPPPQGSGYGYGQQQQSNYPPQQQGGYQAQPAGPAQLAGYKQAIQSCIQENGLQSFYPPNSPVVDHLANKAAAQLPGLCQRWRINPEIGNDLCKLGLYDTVIYIDDSGSMQFEENGERIKDLRLILERVASVCTIFDEDGVSIRFMNARYDLSLLENIRSEQQIEQLMRTVQFKGLTPMGTELRNKVIDGIVVPKLRNRTYTKPILCIVITDGQPAGETPNTVFDTIKYAAQEVGRSFGPGGIAFQFAQVGNDLKAREFLSKLDEDPVVGKMVDCTSNFESESDEMRQKGVDLTPELWLVKLLLGAIDRSYDSKDEGPSGAGGPGQYGAPPPPGGGYGAPPPQGGYGGAPYPPQGRPPGGSGGYPPQQQQGGQGYGRGYPPPQQGGYGGQSGPPRY